jgi:lysozyme family protein
MPFVRRRPLLRAAAVGGVAYMGAKAGTRKAESQAQEQAEQQEPQPQPAPPPQASAATDAASDRISQLKQLADLKASGALTDEEFDREKQRILG